jgi:serine/threonine-protein kinase
VATALQDQLQHALGERYALERELAPGGMSRLFLATEPALERKVVVKLLPPDFESEVSAERFRREMLVTARLQHPHILPVLDAGARDGLLYYVMPYVSGESLRARLERGRLTVAEATRILRELADALACAHEVGVVHRDVKPENVLFQHGHAVLADFGVARVLEQARSGDRLTGTGLGLGTLGYMAPEQLGGEPTVDARADLYALGVVAYEMLTGAAPFAGVTPMRLVAMHLTERPRSIAEVRPEVPAALAGLVAKLLEKEPADRPSTAGDVVRELDDVDASPQTRPRRVSLSKQAARGDPHEFFFTTVLARTHLTDEQAAWVKSVFVPRAFKKGEFFLRPGEATHGAFVTKGLFRMYTIGPNGAERIIRFSNEGGWLGDLQSATTGTPNTYFFEAIEPSEALVFDMPSFERLLTFDAEGAREFRMGLQRSREAMERRIALMLNATAEERYADFVARHPALARRIPSRMLASYLGMSPRTLSSIRRKSDAQ